MEKLPGDTEIANVLVGQLDFLDQSIIAFCRLDPPVVLGDMAELSFPSRFVFFALGQTWMTSLWEFSELGRAAAALFNDKVR